MNLSRVMMSRRILCLDVNRQSNKGNTVQENTVFRCK